MVSVKGKLNDAVRFGLNERKYLYTFLENGDVPIYNNRAKNAIRPFAVGRKNCLFSNTSKYAGTDDRTFTFPGNVKKHLMEGIFVQVQFWI